MNDKNSLQNNEQLKDDDLNVSSKSAKKREMLALQALGQELAMMSKRQYQKIKFPSEALAEAVTFYRGIPDKKYEARRRQMQFIGKLMRHVTPNSLQAQVQAARQTDAEDKRKHHLAEQWRDRLIDDPKQATEFLNQFETDAQCLNQTVRQARKAIKINVDRGESRVLYRILLAAIAH